MIVYLDTETTGLESLDVICSIGVIIDNGNDIQELYGLFNEGKLIPPQASSIHHITNEMIQNKPELRDSEIWNSLEKINTKNTILVGHNIGFDLNKLQNLGFDYQGKIIDTLRISKHLLKDSDSYSLQFLRYDLKLYREEDDSSVAHHALSDAKLTRLLLSYFLSMVSLEEMLELSSQNVLLEKFSFGKYKGKYIEEIAMYDRGYLEWSLNNVVDLDDDLRYSINYYL